MKKLFTIYTFVFMLLSNVAVYAQGDEDDNGNLEGDDAPAAPINTKLVILLIVGLSYSFYTYKKNREVIK